MQTGGMCAMEIKRRVRHYCMHTRTVVFEFNSERSPVIYSGGCRYRSWHTKVPGWPLIRSRFAKCRVNEPTLEPTGLTNERVCVHVGQRAPEGLPDQMIRKTDYPEKIIMKTAS